MEEEELYCLFIIQISNGLRSEVSALYARDDGHAREQAAAWLKQRRELPIIRVEAYPGGYTFSEAYYPLITPITLPGRLTASIAEKLMRRYCK